MRLTNNSQSLSEYKSDTTHELLSRISNANTVQLEVGEKDAPTFSIDNVEVKLDESKKLKNIFHNFNEYYNSHRFIKNSSYITSSNLNNAEVVDNSINLVPGTNISLGKHGGKELMLHVRDKDCGLSWDSTPIGTDYFNEYNDTLKYMLNYKYSDTLKYTLNGVQYTGGVYDPSKLSKEQQNVLNEIQNRNESIINQIGGSSEYESLSSISNAIDDLIRVANGQMSFSHFGFVSGTSETIKMALDKLGINTSKEFYVNGQKFIFSENGNLNYAK